MPNMPSSILWVELRLNLNITAFTHKHAFVFQIDGRQAVGKGHIRTHERRGELRLNDKFSRAVNKTILSTISNSGETFGELKCIVKLRGDYEITRLVNEPPFLSDFYVGQTFRKLFRPVVDASQRNHRFPRGVDEAASLRVFHFSAAFDERKSHVELRSNNHFAGFVDVTALFSGHKKRKAVREPPDILELSFDHCLSRLIDIIPILTDLHCSQALSEIASFVINRLYSEGPICIYISPFLPDFSSG